MATFIIKNIDDKKDLGEVTYSRKKFKVDISASKEREGVEDILNQFWKDGIRDLGEVILREPINPGNPLFLNEVKNQLARKGYILIQKKK